MRYSIFRIEVPDPYPHLNARQLRRASGLSGPYRYINTTNTNTTTTTTTTMKHNKNHCYSAHAAYFTKLIIITQIF